MLTNIFNCKSISVQIEFDIWFVDATIICHPSVGVFLSRHIYLIQTSNLNQHIKAVHWELKPFVCGMPGCNKRFTYKHARDNHEKSGCHIYTPVSFSTSSTNHSLPLLVNAIISVISYETSLIVWIITIPVQGGDFVETDEQFRSRPRGGRKRKYPVIETLMRKRIIPPVELDLARNEGPECPSWQFGSESED